MKFLLEGEAILKSVRRHWFFVAGQLIFFLFLTVAPFVIFPIFFVISRSAGLSFISSVDIGPLMLFAYGIWFLIVWMMAFTAWTNYYLDVWYITNMRVIDINQSALFNRAVSSIRLDMIQDASIMTRGFIQVFLGVADVRIETAGESGTFIIKDAVGAEDLKQFISQESRKAFEKYHTSNIRVESSGPVKITPDSSPE
ncbi:MAG: PH domain-containing protein [Candidatus Paceibacterota bacterium]|jgi:uncharacterized membrane protein YdbT with pleckstrin-like domain